MTVEHMDIIALLFFDYHNVYSILRMNGTLLSHISIARAMYLVSRAKKRRGKKKDVCAGVTSWTAK